MEVITPGLVNTMAGIAIGGGLLIGVWWLIAIFSAHSREKEEQLPQAKAPEGLGEVFAGVPLALTIFFIFMGVSMLAYVLSVWAFGVSY